MTFKSKAKTLTPFGVGFARIFECQVVEDLKNRYQSLVRAFFVYASELFVLLGPIDFYRLLFKGP